MRRRRGCARRVGAAADGAVAVDDACEILDSLPDLTEALAATDPELRRRVFEAFRLWSRSTGMPARYT
jgi:hypothetical protein